MDNSKQPSNVDIERNLVNLWKAIEDMSLILNGVADTLLRISDACDFNPAIDILEGITEQCKLQRQIIKDELVKVGSGH